jgi:DNA-binding NtrC family response regulator
VSRAEITNISGTLVSLDTSRPLLVCHTLRISVIEGPDRGSSWEVKAPHLQIGTANSNDVRLTDSMVSRFHCQVLARGDTYMLRDMESTNGTYLQGARIIETFLAPGTRITLGQTELLFECRKKWEKMEESEEPRFGQLVGRSAVMRTLFGLLGRVASSRLACILCGETGTGKELAAKGIHARSDRATMPFVTVDCGSLPDTLIQSEMFGHEKGAFTGASELRRGAFELANGGTLFLDEIGELPPELQTKLLGALERKEIKRVGAEEPIEIDVRVIGATHRDLSAMVTSGAFREDLYYRLAEVVITLPPLRDHVEDIPVIVETFLADERNHGARVTGVAPAVLDELSKMPWNGNVRELRNVVRRAVALCTSQVLTLEDIALGAHRIEPRGTSEPVLPGLEDDFAEQPLKTVRKRVVDALEKEYLTRLVKKYNGDIERISQIAELHPVSVRRLLKQHGVDEKPR